jgi:misacylated tRNA(Ala) deacylase
MINLATRFPYVLEFDTVVTHVNEDGTVELEQTYFYPTGGGQPHDTGIIKHNDEEFTVREVKKQGSHIVHVVDRAGLAAGDKVHCIIDEQRRTRHRNMHTATHVLCAIIEKAENAKVTGNQISAEKTRIDFNIKDGNPEKLQQYVAEANRIIREGKLVKKYIIGRDELLQKPEMVKLAVGFPENVTEIHIVDIEGVDAQPCGGTHVDNTAEIGTIAFEKSESRGKNNRRVYFTVD